MVWSQIERRRVSAADPKLHNAEISRRLGARWRRLSTVERRPYVEEAERLRVMHSVEFPDYKYTPRKSRKTRPTSARRHARATTNRKSPSSDDVTQLPVDAYDSEVSRYFATSRGPALSGRRSSKNRAAVGRRRSGAGSGAGSRLPPTPDSSVQYRSDRELFRVIVGDRPPGPAAAASSQKHSSRSSRFEFPTSDVQLGSYWTETMTAGGDDDSDEVDALDTPISLELDAACGTSTTARCSLFNDDHDAVTPSFGAESATTMHTAAGDALDQVDYCTPEVAAIVRDDWLEETIHNDALL